MFNPLKIRELINDRKLSDKKFSMKKFCESIGITNAALMGILERGAMPKVSTLENIANYFEKDMNYFFDIQTKKIQIESVNVKMTDGNEYILKRFEELIEENTKLTIRVKELEGRKKYTLPDVPVSHAAEAQVELKKKQ